VGTALDALEVMRPAARIINLETSITTSEHAAPKDINYRMHPRNVEALTRAAVDCCVLANNHVLDWRETGLEKPSLRSRAPALQRPAPVRISNRRRHRRVCHS
jgi:poly-gamma-glutamate capsule biosynthesis protein CapA/YwtB (metallophosphatase superfamily)